MKKVTKKTLSKESLSSVLEEISLTKEKRERYANETGNRESESARIIREAREKERIENAQ